MRAYRPHAVQVAALVGGERYLFSHIESGLFAVALPFTNLADYRLEVSYDGGGESPDAHTVADAYRFLPTLGEVDLHLFAEGRHERLWEVLGAHPRSFTTPDGVVNGVSFAVWAPNAKGVSLIGEFNHWDGNEARCVCWGRRACGNCSGRISRRAGCTNSGCTVPTVRSPTAPTRWPSPPRCRRRRGRG